MTPQTIREMINNGDVPSFDYIKKAFPDHAGAVWHIRMAAFGSVPDAIEVVGILLGPKARWHIGYDNKASVGLGVPGERGWSAISVTPGHALIVATLDAFIAQGKPDAFDKGAEVARKLRDGNA